MAAIELDIIKKQTAKLLPKQKLELIEYLSGSIAPKTNGRETKVLKFGKYRNSGRTRSADDDFKIAEWHPTEAELNGD